MQSFEGESRQFVYCVWFRGRGPLKSTMDVIGAAKKISEAGANLDKFCRQVADQVNGCLLSFQFIFSYTCYRCQVLDI